MFSFKIKSCLPYLMLALLLAGAATLAGCGEKTITMSRPEAVPPKTTPVKKEPVAQPKPVTPKDFYERGEYAVAERKAGDALANANLSPQEKSETWQYYILAAAANNHLHLALKGLDNWAQSEPGIENTAAWQNAWLDTVARFPAYEAKEQAAIRQNAAPSATFSARIEAVLALKASDPPATALALTNMAALQQRFSSPEKSDMEAALFRQLARSDAAAFSQLYGQITEANANTYPYSIIGLEQARRLMSASDPAQKESGRLLAQSLLQNNAFSDPALAQNLLASAPGATETTPNLAEADLQKQGTVALLLPMQGKYSSLAWKISRGATAAQHDLARNGIGANVVVIDSDAPDWQQKVAALPKAVVIGGPMNQAVFDQGKAGGLFANRAVFAFLPQLAPGEEGAVAWRFFSSPKDQITTLLNFCKEDLGIYAVGSLYPSDSYGERMNTMLHQEAADFSMQSTSTPYSPKNAADWNSSVRSFLATRKGLPFEAAFLPDTWSNAKAITSYIFYNQEDRLVLMGTALWEQSLYKDRSPDATNYFRLGVFPGSFNAEAALPAKDSLISLLTQLNPSGGGKPEQADFWTALGFDFVRLAMRLGQPEKGLFAEDGWSAANVNSNLAVAEKMDWSMAPIHWTPEGLASQRMFLFTPSETGFAPVQVNEFKAKLSNAKSTYDTRWKKQP